MSITRLQFVLDATANFNHVIFNRTSIIYYNYIYIIVVDILGRLLQLYRCDLYDLNIKYINNITTCSTNTNLLVVVDLVLQEYKFNINVQYVYELKVHILYIHCVY